ncbi:MAG: ABC transporter permease subunit [Clostridia bacterium]|nr:ABC transporter permease subunit [Clostridia bacterium]
MNAVKEKKERKNEAAKRILFTALSACFWIGVWWLLALVVGEEWILPAPPAVVKAFFAAFEGGALPLYLLRSCAGIMAGYFAGVTVGFLLAALTARFRALHLLFSPLLTVVRATPVASFILILWIFFARSAVPAASVMLIVTPIVWANCETGFLSYDRKLFEAAKAYGLSAKKKVRYLFLPAVSPYFGTAALTALGMAWKAGVAAEVLCTPEGTIGRMIWISKRDIITAELFAYTAAVILVCFLFEKLFKLLFKRFGVRKRRRAPGGAAAEKGGGEA